MQSLDLSLGGHILDHVFYVTVSGCNYIGPSVLHHSVADDVCVFGRGRSPFLSDLQKT
jgi:hypothetical protein